MAPVTYYERRRGSLTISFEDRRMEQRRGQDQVSSSQRRRMASRVRRYGRESFKIPVSIKMDGKEVSGYTQDISPEGLLLYSGAALNIGTLMTLQFSFMNVCSLNVSGLIIYCDGQAMRIKFQKIESWEQKILNFAVEELKQSAVTQKKSLLTIFVCSEPSQKTENFTIRNLQPWEKKSTLIQNEENPRNNHLSALKRELKNKKRNKKFTPDPEWVIEMDQHLKPYRQAILDCRLVQETSSGELSLRQVQGWNIQFYPFIESFPRFIALNLAKVTDSTSQSFLIDNIKVEKMHAAYWIDMANGFGIDTDELLNTPIIPEVEALTHWLWSINYRGSLVEGVAATNYAIEGITQGIASTAVKGFHKYHSDKDIILDKRAYLWMEAHSVYDDLHPLEALEIIKRNATSIEMQQKARHAAQRSLEYFLRALEACYAAYS
ncbi:MAG: iron-containing redox enzyme family protein [Thermodesulfobacteriota bacterium]